jgi:hypothetical protein
MDHFKQLRLSIWMMLNSFMTMKSLFNMDITESIAWGTLLIISINRLMGGNSTYKK